MCDLNIMEFLIGISDVKWGDQELSNLLMTRLKADEVHQNLTEIKKKRTLNKIKIKLTNS